MYVYIYIYVKSMAHFQEQRVLTSCNLANSGAGPSALRAPLPPPAEALRRSWKAKLPNNNEPLYHKEARNSLTVAPELSRQTLDKGSL